MKVLREMTPQQRLEQRFSLPDRPEGDIPQVPESFDDLTDGQLMEMYAQFIGWINYSNVEMTQAVIEEEMNEHAWELLQAQIMVGDWAEGKKETVTSAKARRDSMPQVVDAKEAYLHSRSYRKLVTTVYDRCERISNLLSRELSRRISLAPQERRLHKYIP
jgi:hypothetical protein